MRSILLALAIVACIYVVAGEVNCSTTIKDDEKKQAFYFDLNPLYHGPGHSDDVFYRVPDSDGDVILINVCGQTTAECASDTSVCFQKSTPQDYVFYQMGKTSSQNFTHEEHWEKPEQANGDDRYSHGLVVTYTGQSCPFDGSRTFKATLEIFCSNSDPGFIYEYTATNSGCDVVMKMDSVYGCGKSVPYVKDDDGTSGGEVFATVVLVLLLVGVILYFGIGAFYQWKVNHASTFSEFIIHKDFWVSIPFLVRDGVLFISHGFKKGDYVSV